MTLQEATVRIKRFYIKNRRMPSVAELGKELHLASKKTSFNWAKKLIDAGLLGKDEKGKLFPKALFSVPYFGIIRAGMPSPSYPAVNDSLDLYKFILDLPGDVFSLSIIGDSMIDASIREGDIALVDPNKQPVDGDIVAALVDNECTLKYFYKDYRGVRLVPANPEYPTIYPESELIIQGVVIHLIRRFR